MKRVNAGLYARTRKQVQDARAALLHSSSAKALEILGTPRPPDAWLSKLLEVYRDKLRAHNLQQMCDKVEELLTSGHEDEAHRWLGFVQGVLCGCGVYTIPEMQAHMRGEGL